MVKGEVVRSFPKNVMSDTGQRGRLLHNEQLSHLFGIYFLYNNS